MKKLIPLALCLFLASGGLWAQISVSGILDSSVVFRAGSAYAPSFSYGIEKYANLRMIARLREMASVFADVNLIALAGDNAAAMQAQSLCAHGMATTPFVAGSHFIAGFELERLYFRINTDNVRFDGGLTRIPIGHGLFWRPTDFLNPVNPLITNARPRAVLGAELSWWPTFDWNLVFFGAAPHNPFSQSGAGGHVGMTVEREWSRVVAKALFSFESPRGGLIPTAGNGWLIPSARYGIQRIGLSVKADLELGLVLDVLYTNNFEQQSALDGLALSFGFDYSFFRGNLIIAAEYLFSGAASSTSISGGGHLANEHYLYTGFTWLFDDFTNAGFAMISGLSDISFTPIATFSREIFQGATLTFTALVPLDRRLFSGNANHRGELGPLPPGLQGGRYFDFTTMLRLRF
ncbi:MAG: hypothetical protein LBG93_03350 [Treponema sp.]|nr:hypothetical protein [Treponema sp.]